MVKLNAGLTGNMGVTGSLSEVVGGLAGESYRSDGESGRVTMNILPGSGRVSWGRRTMVHRPALNVPHNVVCFRNLSEFSESEDIRFRLSALISESTSGVGMVGFSIRYRLGLVGFSLSQLPVKLHRVGIASVSSSRA